jgi:pimeloyl-ACP methyl ester carboxylesterase
MKLEKVGDKNKKPAVFLHGYGAHPKLYENFVNQLAQDYYVYVPEIFGLEGICRRDFDENMRVLGGFMHEHKLGQSTVIGHSYGALAALHLAAEFPKLRQSIAVNPLLPALFNTTKLRLQLSNLQRDLGYATGELRGMLTNPQVGLTYGRNVFSDPVGYVQGAFKAIASSLPEKRSEVPVEILYADLDTLFHIEDTDLDKWRQILPNLKFTSIPDYSHNWLIYHGGYAFDTMATMLGKS